jgi:Lon protease-like protein
MTAATEIPLFPLSGILLPHGRMPLQIFEQRYLDLIKQCLRDGAGFGVIWLRQGSEVSVGRGETQPRLGDYGTMARIVDWDQLPNGLLGITIEGAERFELHRSYRADSGLNLGEVTIEPPLAPTALEPRWSAISDVLKNLLRHPHVERLGYRLDMQDAWQVGFGLLQMLPVQESVKHQLLQSRDHAELLGQLDAVLRELSGED